MNKLLLILFLFGLGYLVLWPVPVSPVAWEAPEDNGLTGEFAKNSKLADAQLIAIEDDYGPEDLAINEAGVVYISLHSGAIMRLNEASQKMEPWVNTGGRPLGIEFDNNGNLIVADAYLGLLSINKEGKIQVLTNKIDGRAILYADDLDISSDGKIYFSDASTKFGAQAFGGTYPASLLDILEHGGHGRLLMFDPATNKTIELANGLNFANGVAISHDENSVLVNETGTYRVIRYWLAGTKQGQVEVVIDNLPGFPDNLAKGLNDTYWLGLASPRSKPLDALSSSPLLRKVVQRLPAFMRPQAQYYGHVVQISEQGDVLLSLQDPSDRYPITTGVIETEDTLYISSLVADSLAIMHK